MLPVLAEQGALAAMFRPRVGAKALLVQVTRVGEGVAFSGPAGRPQRASTSLFTEQQSFGLHLFSCHTQTPGLTTRRKAVLASAVARGAGAVAAFIQPRVWLCERPPGSLVARKQSTWGFFSFSPKESTSETK